MKNSKTRGDVRASLQKLAASRHGEVGQRRRARNLLGDPDTLRAICDGVVIAKTWRRLYVETEFGFAVLATWGDKFKGTMWCVDRVIRVREGREPEAR